MFRVIFLALLAVNLLGIAALAGLFPPPPSEGEPQRLLEQINPSQLRLLKPDEVFLPPPGAPPPARVASNVTPPPAAGERCVQFSELNSDMADALMTSLSGDPLVVQRSGEQSLPTWWVHLPPATSAEQAEARAAELRAVGVERHFIVREPGPRQFAVSLGLFRSEASAHQEIGRLESLGVRNVALSTRQLVLYSVVLQGESSALDRRLADASLPSSLKMGPCP